MISVSRLVPGSVLSATAISYYLCPANSAVVIKRGDFCNTTGGAVSVSAYIVPAGGAAGTANTLISGFSVGAGVTYVSPELSGLVMAPGDTLQALGAGVTFIVSGIVVTA